MFYFEISETPYNQEKYGQFLTNMLSTLSREQVQQAVVVMDNVPFHKSAAIRQLIAQHGHRCEYLPPYSPFLNPIENLFSQWKSMVRRRNCQNEEDLREAIRSASEEITEEHCRNMFRNMERYIPRCLDGTPIDTDDE